MTRIAKLLGLTALISTHLSLLPGCGNKCSSVFDCKSGELCYFGTCTPAQEKNLSCVAEDDCGKVPAGQVRPYTCIGGRCRLNPFSSGPTADAGAGDVGLSDLGPHPDALTLDATPDSGVAPADSGVVDVGPNDSGPDPCTLPTPAPPATGFNPVFGPGAPTYTGVYARCANDVWAVGQMGVISHWDSIAVSAVNSGQAGTLNHAYSGAWNDAWVVGAMNTILHWDGAVWNKVALGASASTFWYAVWGTGPNDVYFAGDQGQLLHYTGGGGAPAPITLPPPMSGMRDSITGVSGTGTGTAATIYLGGGCGGACGRGPFAYRYQNGVWTELTGLNGLGAITGVWASTASDVWFVETGSGSHWNGTGFDTPQPPGGSDIWGLNPTQVYVANGGLSQWDGTSWNSVTIPPPTAGNVLLGVGGTAVGGTQVWVVGNLGNLRLGP